MNEKLAQKLNNIDWKDFIIEDLFETQRGRRLTKANQINGETPYVSSKGLDNGVDNFIGNNGKDIRKFEDCLTIANSGSVGVVFYHPYEFVASDHVTKLEKKKLNKYQYLFIATVLKKIGEKYSFNREISDPRLKREKILLPATDLGEPDWDFMSRFMKELENSIDPQISYKKHKVKDYRKIKEVEWGEFFIEDIFKVFTGATIKQSEFKEGSIPRVTVTDRNNGISMFTKKKNENNFRVYENFISVSFLGSVFYQPNKTSLDMKVHGIKPKNIKLNKYNSLFLTSILKKMSNKFSYGYQLSMSLLKRQKIILPITDLGKPDWEFMEQYMKRMEMKTLKTK